MSARPLLQWSVVVVNNVEISSTMSHMRRSKYHVFTVWTRYAYRQSLALQLDCPSFMMLETSLTYSMAHTFEKGASPLAVI